MTWTYYFANSEQVPSSVGLGVLMEKDNTVRCAGGFIVQVMPFVEEQVLVRLEENISKIHSVTALLEQGHTPESLLQEVLKGMDIEITDTLPTAFACDCSKEKIEKAIVSIGERDIKEMIAEGKDIEVKCHFCNTAYTLRGRAGKLFTPCKEKLRSISQTEKSNGKRNRA